MHVLVVGGGGREHALAWALRRSPQVTRLAVAPGNGGTAAIADTLSVATIDVAGQVRAAREWGADFVVVGPEVAIAAGLVDALAAEGIPAFGPSQAAGRIESSKRFAKELMADAGVPTARWRSFDDLTAAKRYLHEIGAPVVIKADGLAAGKGVVIAETLQAAEAALAAAMTDRAFGDAGNQVVIEEVLSGPEVTLMALVDGRSVVPLPASCDYKRIGDGDIGPNTGGMGCYSAPPWFGPAEFADAVRRLVQPIVDALAARGTPFRGLLYTGLMVTADGPKVIEYNARFGDPETQVVLPSINEDVAGLLFAAATGSLAGVSVAPARSAVSVVLASAGYPGAVTTGVPIHGLDRVEGVEIFHSGTRLTDLGLVTDGGRVLNVVATAPTIAEARQRAYAAIETIHFDGMQFRRDIAARETSA